MKTGFHTTYKGTTKKRTTSNAVENDPEKYLLIAMTKPQSDISDTLTNVWSLLSSGKSENVWKSCQVELMKRFDEVNKDRLSIANGSIDTICEERKISMLEIYNKEIMKITDEMIQLRTKK